MMEAAKRPPHPGTIRFEDEIRQKVRVAKVAEVPESVAYVQIEDTFVPVARVTARLRGEERLIQSYDEKGHLLQTTRQIRDLSLKK